MIGAPPRLLAKAADDPENPSPAQSLVGHAELVLDAADALMDLEADASLQACGLSGELRPRLTRIVRLAAAIHDLGKCSDHFQEMVRGRRHVPQLVRHEALSLWLCWPGQPLGAWARASVENDDEHRLAAIAAAAHHRKFWSKAVAPDGSGAGSRMLLLTAHLDFAQLLRSLSTALGGPLPGPLANLEIEVSRRKDPRREFEAWELETRELLAPDSVEERLVAVGKALVLAADVAGSALPRAGQQTEWVRSALSRRDLRDVLCGVVQSRLKRRSLRPFQRAVASSTAPIALVQAGCGSGKTLAAYQWAAEMQPSRRLWVTYPTTGTATEGFRGYLVEPEVDARLEHSRAEVDVEILGLSDGEDVNREADRLDAIRAWDCDVITCTADTVLGLVQNQRRGLYAWPSLAQGAVVFDEIHAYDDRLFGCLLRFLRALPGIPVLLMTASLPEPRTSALQNLCRRVHGVDMAVVDGPEELEALPRYRLADREDIWAAVRATYSAGGKALWVSNTVDRCLSVAEGAEREGIAPLVYHSRFRYRDRVERHRDMMSAFDGAGAAFASTTQVAEMSLDISADLLITDVAPVPALIQRLGRLNRRSTPEAFAPPKPFIALPFHGPPYAPQELAEALAWLDRIRGRDLSQRDLVAGWDQSKAVAVPPVQSEWLDGGFCTIPAHVREGSLGITVILAQDADDVRKGRSKPQAVAVPMNPPPRGVGAWQEWPRAAFFPVPPRQAVSYDARRGARWSVP